MKKRRNLVIGLIVLAVLLARMVSYRVRYNEMAVLTTFGRADERSVKNADGQGAGLHFKWPWPIQEVARVYDARVQILEDQLEEQQTLDKQDVIVSTFVAWRIDDPLRFYRAFGNVDQAERELRYRLRSARAEIGQYTFADLTNLDPQRLRLPEAEEKMLGRMQQELDQQGYGIDLRAVGIKRVILAEAVSQKVFERMRSNRQRLAQRARSEGDAAASDIVAKARSAEQRILAFANQRAEAIRAEGDAAAAEYYRVFRENEDFAIFLRKLEEYQKVLGNNTTFLIDAGKGPFDLFGQGPAAPAAGAGQPEAGDRGALPAGVIE